MVSCSRRDVDYHGRDIDYHGIGSRRRIAPPRKAQDKFDGCATINRISASGHNRCQRRHFSQPVHQAVIAAVDFPKERPRRRSKSGTAWRDCEVIQRNGHTKAGQNNENSQTGRRVSRVHPPGPRRAWSTSSVTQQMRDNGASPYVRRQQDADSESSVASSKARSKSSSSVQARSRSSSEVHRHELPSGHECPFAIARGRQQAAQAGSFRFSPTERRAKDEELLMWSRKNHPRVLIHSSSMLMY